LWGSFEELTPGQIENQLATGLIGPMNVTRAVPAGDAQATLRPSDYRQHCNQHGTDLMTQELTT
jgi:hypothetical protein